MKGRIVIECDEQGTHLDVQVSGTEKHERVFLVHALGKALSLESEDYVILAIAEASGILSDKGPTKVSIDRAELLKQLKEEQLES